ncbi:MAG TPA: DUF2269 family protein [Chitinophaga sp.]
MGTINLFPLALVLHIIGVALLTAGSLGSYVTLKQLWKYYPEDERQATAVFKTSQAYNIFFAIGGVLILISGFLLLRVFQFAVTKQLWFEVKMGLVIFLILNARIFGGPVIKKLQGLLSSQNGVADVLQLGMLRRRLGIFHALQLLALLIIFVLAVYKFQ